MSLLVVYPSEFCCYFSFRCWKTYLYPFQLKLTFLDISFMFYDVFLIRAQPTNTQSLAKDYRSLSVVWVSRQLIEILMAISRSYIQICNNLTVFRTNFKVNKYSAFFAWLIRKFVVSMEIIKATQKSSKFLLTICPDKENIVNISKPHQRL